MINMADNQYLCKKTSIKNTRGLHARASAKFVEQVNKFNSDIFVSNKNEKVSGKSIMGLLSLGATQGSDIYIYASGSDAKLAIKHLIKLVDEKFGEE